MKPLRRRAFAKASGFKLIREKDKYIFLSRLSAIICDSAEGTKGDRDDAVYNLVVSMKKWSFNNKAVKKTSRHYYTKHRRYSQ